MTLRDTLLPFLMITTLLTALPGGGFAQDSPDTPSEATGRLTVTCAQNQAEVTVDGRTLSCPAEFELPVGSYTVAVRAPDHVTKEFALDIPPGGNISREVDLAGESIDEDAVAEETVAQVEPTRSSAWVNYIAGGSIGAGAGFIISGVALNLSSIARNDEIDEARQNNNPERLAALEDEADKARRRAIAFYATGGVFLAGGITLAVLNRPPSTSSATNTTGAPAPKASLGFGPTSARLTIDW